MDQSAYTSLKHTNAKLTERLQRIIRILCSRNTNRAKTTETILEEIENFPLNKQETGKENT